MRKCAIYLIKTGIVIKSPRRGGRDTMQKDDDNRTTKLPPRSRLNSPKKTSEMYGPSVRSLKRAWSERRLNYYTLGHRTVLLDTRDVEEFLAKCRVDALHN